MIDVISFANLNATPIAFSLLCFVLAFNIIGGMRSLGTHHQSASSKILGGNLVFVFCCVATIPFSCLFYVSYSPETVSLVNSVFVHGSVVAISSQKTLLIFSVVSASHFAVFNSVEPPIFLYVLYVFLMMLLSAFLAPALKAITLATVDIEVFTRGRHDLSAFSAWLVSIRYEWLRIDTPSSALTYFFSVLLAIFSPIVIHLLGIGALPFSHMPNYLLTLLLITGLHQLALAHSAFMPKQLPWFGVPIEVFDGRGLPLFTSVALFELRQIWGRIREHQKLILSGVKPGTLTRRLALLLGSTRVIIPFLREESQRHFQRNGYWFTNVRLTIKRLELITP